MPKEADRVAETTTTTGTGTLTLGGALAGRRSFGTAYGTSGSTDVAYVITLDSASQWEVGLGTFLGAANQLQRDTVLSSSAGGSKVSFSAGSKTVYVARPAEATLVARARRATDVPVEIRAAAGQSGDLLQAWNASGTKALSVDPDGILVAAAGGTFAGNIRVGVDASSTMGSISGGGLYIYSSSGSNIGFRTEGPSGAAVARIIPAGTAAGSDNVVMTREKADARYAAISSLRYKDGVTVAERVPGFLGIAISRWTFGGEMAEDDFRRGRAGYGHIVEYLAPVFPEGVENDEQGRPDRLNVGAILGALHAEIQHLSARVDALA